MINLNLKFNQEILWGKLPMMYQCIKMHESLLTGI